jgi:SAM-dependent methyltransferase/diadenosine tetraphosphate (Ap4A) HIT family hydrolase
MSAATTRDLPQSAGPACRARCPSDGAEYYPSDVSGRTIAAYEGIARSYAETWFEDDVMEEMIERFCALLDVPGEVLDAGCGPGRDVLSMAKRGTRAVGLDLSSRMLEEARGRVPDALFRQVDFRRLPYPDSTFAGIWSCACLQHLPDGQLTQVLKEFRRTVKPGGVLGVSVEEGSGEFLDSAGRYRRLQSKEECISSLAGAGFRPVSVSGVTAIKATPGGARNKRWLQVLAIAPENHTDELSKPNDTTCYFCPGRLFDVNRSLAVPAADSILWGDSAVFVTPDVAPVVDGHLLLITTGHTLCLGACDSRAWQRMQAAQELVRRLFDEAYGLPTVFLEHGPARPKEAGACVDHCHLHCLPTALPLRGALDRRLGVGQNVSLEELGRWHASGRSYIYVDDESGRFAYPASDLPSQYLRQLVRSFGDGHGWRWQSTCQSANTKHSFRQTVAQLSPYADRIMLEGRTTNSPAAGVRDDVGTTHTP